MFFIKKISFYLNIIMLNKGNVSDLFCVHDNCKNI